MLSKIDYAIAALVGMVVGLLALPTLINLGIRDKAFLISLPAIIPFFWVFGIWFGGFLGRWLPFMTQFGKFVAVGFLNTSIDFGILNILSWTTGITKGFILGGVNAPGFVIAVFNSYFFNKLWVFKDRDKKEGLMHDFPTFLAVTFTGLLINSGLVVLIATFIPPLFGVSESVWLNIAKVAATSISFIWNFLGFKFIVFKHKPQPESQA